MSTKRSRVFTVAAAGTLTLAAAISAAAVALPPSATTAPAGTAAAYVTTVGGHAAAASSAQSAVGSGIQQAVLFDRMRSIDAQREQQALAAARAKARAAARKAAAKAAASKVAASKAAAKAAAAQQSAGQGQVEQQDAVTTASGSPQQTAEQMLSQYGWSSSQFSCLDPLWIQESGWNVYAENPSSGAYGIAQALPGAEMASAGSDWESDAATQIRWGLTYIQGRYGSPCAAWAHEEADGWY
jgi:hypothetical protein